MDTDADLDKLIRQKDHLNVLRYIRLYQLRKPDLVVDHGKALLKPDLSRSVAPLSWLGGQWWWPGSARGTASPSLTEQARLAALEQVCLAAVDLQDHSTAELCLKRLKQAGVGSDSARFRLLLARCLESANDPTGAKAIYESILQQQPACALARKRLYALVKAMPGQEVVAADLLGQYLQQNAADTAAWYELAQLRKNALGDYKGAVYCLHEVLLWSPTDAALHVELAESYQTAAASTGTGGAQMSLEYLTLARKHMAQALELDRKHRRAQLGLVVTAHACWTALESMSASSKRNAAVAAEEDFEIRLCKELIRFGAELVLQSYPKRSPMYLAMQALMKEYTEDL